MVNQSGGGCSSIGKGGMPAHTHTGMGSQSMDYGGGAGNEYATTPAMPNDNDLNQDTYQLLNQQEQLQQYVNYTSISNDNQVSVLFLPLFIRMQTFFPSLSYRSCMCATAT